MILIIFSIRRGLCKPQQQIKNKSKTKMSLRSIHDDDDDFVFKIQIEFLKRPQPGAGPVSQCPGLVMVVKINFHTLCTAPPLSYYQLWFNKLISHCASPLLCPLAGQVVERASERRSSQRCCRAPAECQGIVVVAAAVVGVAGHSWPS